jgi:hypothetical protein
MYLVLDVLCCEALQVEKNARKVMQGQKGIRRERKRYKILNSKLQKL